MWLGGLYKNSFLGVGGCEVKRRSKKAEVVEVSYNYIQRQSCCHIEIRTAVKTMAGFGWSILYMKIK